MVESRGRGPRSGFVSLIVDLRRLTKLDLPSGAGLIAEAGNVGLRNEKLSLLSVALWNFLRARASAGIGCQCHFGSSTPRGVTHIQDQTLPVLVCLHPDTPVHALWSGNEVQLPCWVSRLDGYCGALSRNQATWSRVIQVCHVCSHASPKTSS